MSDFSRPYPLFSVCGLNCGLCPMHIGNYCPGCGGGPGNQPCKIARCSQQFGDIDYCFECAQFPCDKYDGIDQYDSFITHRHQLKDLERAKRIGIEAYTAELEEKMQILRYLLNNVNDGRKKSFYCLAANLLALKDVKTAVEQIKAKTCANNLSQQEKAALAAGIFETIAADRGIVLKLNKKR